MTVTQQQRERRGMVSSPQSREGLRWGHLVLGPEGRIRLSSPQAVRGSRGETLGRFGQKTVLRETHPEDLRVRWTEGLIMVALKSKESRGKV